MNMKKYILALFLAPVLGLTISSCSLEEKSEYFVGPDQYYDTVSQCRIAVNSTYHYLKTLYEFRHFTVTEAHTDLIYEAAPTVPMAGLELSPAQPGFAETIWLYCYKTIMWANGILEHLPSSPIEDWDKLNFMQETATMRAFYYYLLTSHFGDVPFYTEEVATQEDMDRIARYPRMSAVATRAYLIEELNGYLAQMKDADTNPSNETKFFVRTSEIKENRAGAPMALMLVAKMAMWNAAKDTEQTPEYWYDIALTALKELEGIYGSLAQYPLEEIMFRYKNTPESIFEIQHTYTSGALTYVSNLAAVCTPYKTIVEKDAEGNCTVATYDGLTVPELGVDATTWTPARPNLYFSAGLQLYKGPDQRAEINMAWRYPANDTGKEFKSVNTRPWLGPKFWCPNMYTTNDSNNYKVFRYADALLMMAECYCAKQDQTNFLKYLNMTRNRAGLGDYTFRNWEKALAEIQNERARELFGEFQRKFDLVRWGIWYQRTKEFNDYDEVQLNIRPCHEYLPIPAKQVGYSKNALDNKEYNKYGM